MTTFKQFLADSVNPKYLDFRGSTKKRVLKKEMSREIERFKKMKSDDPAAYPDDWTADEKYKRELKKSGQEIPPSKYTKQFAALYGESLDESSVDTALKNKSEKTGVPVKFLRSVYDRGLAAWRTGHRPGVTQHQWAMARVNSFLVGGPARETDRDIWDEFKSQKK